MLDVKDALFVVFGLAFYTIPKITPLGYVSTFYGSWATAAVYAILAFVVRPPARLAESALGMVFCMPAIWVFTTIAYYDEYNSRERFVLRRRLRSESISLAIACTSSFGPLMHSSAAFTRNMTSSATNTSVDLRDQLMNTLALSSFRTGWLTNHRTASYLFALALWASFTLGGWTSLPDKLKFVDQDTGWAWFSHCAGLTVFLLVMTRRLLWLMIVPLGGAFVLWMLTLTMPASWIIISAHSVGYGLLLASVVIAMGVFGWFMLAWNELVAFLTRTCFLYPQLQAGMETDFPLLVKIVSEYTANFDPQILSARRASPPMALQLSRENVPVEEQRGAEGGKKAEKTIAAPTSSRRHRKSVCLSEVNTTERSNDASVTSTNTLPYSKGIGAENEQAMKKTGSTADDIKCVGESTKEMTGAQLAQSEARIVSVLPSFTPGKCFFCSKNEAEHYVPACGMWGKWTHWRMNQQHPGLSSSDLSILPSSTTSVPASKRAVAMCTSYYDLQHSNAKLETRVTELEKDNVALASQLKARTMEFERDLAHVQQEFQTQQEKHSQEKMRMETLHRDKLDSLMQELNRTTREQKASMKKLEAAAAQKVTEAENQARSEIAELQTQLDKALQHIQELKKTATTMQPDTKPGIDQTRGSDHVCLPAKRSPNLPLDLDASFTSEDEYDGSSNGSPEARQSPVGLQSGLVALQPSGRLPYAKFLEIEGLRESATAAQRDIDYAARWRNWKDHEPI